LSPNLLAALQAGEYALTWAGGVLLFTILAATLFALASRRVFEVERWFAGKKKPGNENDAGKTEPSPR
jgi:hypothetical protein